MGNKEGGMVIQIIEEEEKVDKFAGEGIVMQIKRSNGWRKKNLRICQLNIGLSRCSNDTYKFLPEIKLS